MRKELGPRIRSVREEKKLSLRGVASAVGISPSLLSQVETGRTQPSVSTLYSLVSHLGISLDDLLGTGGPAQAQPRAAATPVVLERELAEPVARVAVVQRAQDNPVIEMENGVRWERLAAGPGGLVDPLITTYAPGGSSSVEGKLMRHSGIEHAYVLEGELTLKVDFDTWVLHAGDSLCFDSSRPHLYVNHSDRPARGIWFVVGRRELTYRAAEPELGDDARTGDRTLTSAVDVLESLDGLHGIHR